jgi:hypothetical protein
MKSSESIDNWGYSNFLLIKRHHQLAMELSIGQNSYDRSNTIERENNAIVRSIDRIYFVICNSCLWCATYFGIDELESLSSSPTHALSCHICNSCNTKLMPISADVSSRMKYGVSTGMEIEFYRSNDIVNRQSTTNELHQVPI